MSTIVGLDVPTSSGDTVTETRLRGGRPPTTFTCYLCWLGHEHDRQPVAWKITCRDAPVLNGGQEHQAVYACAAHLGDISRAAGVTVDSRYVVRHVAFLPHLPGS